MPNARHATDRGYAESLQPLTDVVTAPGRARLDRFDNGAPPADRATIFARLQDNVAAVVPMLREALLGMRSGTEAGGVVVDAFGQPWSPVNDPFLATSPPLVEPLTHVLAQTAEVVR